MAKSLVRIELKRNDYAKRGLLTLLGASLVLAFVYGKTTGIIGGADEVTAKVANAGGALRPGSDVKMRGVIVGRVSGVGRASDGDVLVDLAMQDGTLDSIPANVVARILPATVFGTTFVDLTTHVPASGEMLKAKAVVPADKTQETLELQQALDDIDRLTKALGPAELASALGSMASALDGRGNQLGTMIDQIDTYLKKLNPKMPIIRTDLAKLAANLQLAQRTLPDLMAAIDDGLVTARTIVAQKATIATIIMGGTTLVQQGNSFLGTNQPTIVKFLNTSGVVVDAIYDNKYAAFNGAMNTNIEVARKLNTILKHGFLDATSTITNVTPPYYTAADRPRFGNSGARVGAPDLGRASVSQLLEGSGKR